MALLAFETIEKASNGLRCLNESDLGIGGIKVRQAYQGRVDMRCAGFECWPCTKIIRFASVSRL